MNVFSPELALEANEHAILNTLIYLNEYFNVINGTPLKKIIPVMHTSVFDKKKKRWFEIIKQSIKRNPHLGELIIGNQSKYMKLFGDTRGLNACTFTDRETGYTAVIIRGTGAGEWLDNGQGIAGEVTDTMQQEQANAYFDKVMKKKHSEQKYLSKTPDSTITVSGHSKGGNKAQYITINSSYRKYITRCLNFDGQGMSPEAIAAFKKRYGDEDYQTSVYKMYGIYSDNDYVNPLGVCIIPPAHQYYFKDSLVEGIWDIEKYHYPDNYLTEDGSFTEQAEEGKFSKYVNNVSHKVETLPPHIRSIITDSIMALIQGKESAVDGSSVSPEEVVAGLALTAPILVSSLKNSNNGTHVLHKTIKEELEKLVKH
ncbi:MAG: DUF2974 domain-containing protein [Lachnoclostridium sp.]|nr:DUF2974 domain-containing protein [Lachnoclostridium sp.]